MKNLSLYLLIALIASSAQATEKPEAQIPVAKTPDVFDALFPRFEEKSNISLEERAENGDADAMYSLSMQSPTITLVSRKVDKKFAYTSFYWANEAHKKGNLDASVRLGVLYEYGVGCEIDIDKALELYNQAAEQNNLNALAQLVLYYQDKDLDKAKEIFAKLEKILNEQENVATDIYLFVANNYLKGDLCDKNLDKFSKMLLDLHEINKDRKGYNYILDDIANALVFCYLKGIGVEKDEEKAKEIFNKGIKAIISTNKNFRAYELGLMKLETAIDYFNLAEAYLNSQKYGTLKDLYADNAQKAEQFFQKAIDMGYDFGYYGFGIIAEDKGNLEEAFEFYKKACKNISEEPTQLEVRVILKLANAYYNGIGTAKDVEKAIELYFHCTDYFNEASSIIGFYYYDKADFEKALKYLKKGAKPKIDSKVYSAIASCYESGLGTKKDIDKAIYYYKKAADLAEEKLEINENIKSLYCSIGVPFDEYIASEPLDKRAMNGDVDAMYELAKNYLAFQGLFAASYQNAHSGFYWYKKAYENGSIEAIDKLGRCYECGFGTILDKDKALEIYKEGWQKGNAFALLRLIEASKPQFAYANKKDEPKDDTPEYLALLELARTRDDLEYEIYEYLAKIALEKKDKEAISFLEKTVKQVKSQEKTNNALFNSYIALAYCYATGTLADKDVERAKKLINELDEFENAKHLIKYPYIFVKNISGLYELESGEDYYCVANIYNPKSTAFRIEQALIPQDLQKAIDLYEKSASLGYTKAKQDLIDIYKNGDDTERKKAFDLCLECLNLKTNPKINDFYLKDYAEYIAKCYKEGKVIEQNMQKSIEYYKKSLDLHPSNNTEAKLNLAEFYFNGEFVEQDYTKAFSYLKDFEGKGYIPNNVYPMLALIYEKGLGGAEINTAKAIKYYEMTLNYTPANKKEKKQEIQSIINKLKKEI